MSANISRMQGIEQASVTAAKSIITYSRLLAMRNGIRTYIALYLHRR